MTRKKLLRVTVAISALTLALAACGQREAPGSAGTGGGGGGDSGGQGTKVAFVPKLVGIPYFEAMKTGGDQAATELGVQFIYQGDTTADPAKQAEIINSLVQQKVTVLAVAPNDPAAVAPLLKRAADAGIKVMTSDTDAPDSVREVFVNQAEDTAIGETTAEALASQMGGEGKWAIVSCGQTAQNLNAWIDIEKRHIQSKYPNMELVDTVYAGEDQAKSVQLAKDLMTAHPDLKGLIGQCSVSAPGVAQAVTELDKIGKVFTTGVSTPSSMKEYIKSGAQAKTVLWDVNKLGFLTVWAGKQLAEGKTFQATNEVPTVGQVKYDAAKKMLVLGPPMVFDKDNVDQYSF
jgi:rhamnose transport system substrate-binding protein